MMNFADAPQKPQSGVSTVIGRSRSPGSHPRTRFALEKSVRYLATLKCARGCNAFIALATARTPAFLASIPAITAFDRH